jgi:hypothetical protein
MEVEGSGKTERSPTVGPIRQKAKGKFMHGASTPNATNLPNLSNLPNAANASLGLRLISHYTPFMKSGIIPIVRSSACRHPSLANRAKSCLIVPNRAKK